MAATPLSAVSWFMERESSGDDSFIPRYPLVSGPSSIGTSRIFIVNQTRPLPGDNPRGQTIQRILIFDDHPDTLRLVLGPEGIAPVDRKRSTSTRWWDPVPGWVLLLTLLVLMLLPLFFRWP
jgi:hypothetical protein